MEKGSNNVGEFIKFNTGMLCATDFFKDEKFERNIHILQLFANQQQVPVEMVDKFISYNFSNSICNNHLHLCDKDGKLIGNVFGAFLRFAKSGYDRTKWEEAHGICVPQWLKEKRQMEKQSNPKKYL